MACSAAAISERARAGAANKDDPGVLRIGRIASAARTPRFVGAHGIDPDRTKDLGDP